MTAALKCLQVKTAWKRNILEEMQRAADSIRLVGLEVCHCGGLWTTTQNHRVYATSPRNIPEVVTTHFKRQKPIGVMVWPLLPLIF